MQGSEGVTLGESLDALEIVLTAPLWPRRDDLSDSGAALHDAIVVAAKPFARAVACGRFDEAMGIAAGWSQPVNRFLDETRVVGHEASERLVRVYTHYVGQIADFSKIQR